MSNIVGIVIDTFSARSKESSLPRPKAKSLNLIKNYGIEFDKFAGKNLNQVVLLVGINSYNLAKENGVDLLFGSLGENILVDFDPHSFDIGTKFKIENTTIQTTQICTVCTHLSSFSEILPSLLKDKRGVYCKIISSGIVEKNRSVEVLND